MKKALVNARLLQGDDWQTGQALLIDGETIKGIWPETDIPDGYQRQDLDGGYLLPGFIDVQVNGGGGVLLNDATELADLERIAQAHRTFGTTALLPTLITTSWQRMQEVAALIREARAANMPGIAGIHFEGPYLNSARKGVHNAAHIRELEDEFIALAGAGDLGSVVVTLAPEKTDPAHIERLVDAGVIVSAGHSMASYEEMTAAIDAGLSGVTHLYNAMTPMESRAPGLIGAAFNSRECYCGFINDGHHVHPATLKAAIAAKGADRMMLVTDAMATIGTNITAFRLDDQEIHLTDGWLTTVEGTLAGSALDMAAAVRNAVTLLDQPLITAIHMASSVPAAFLKQEDQRGTIAAGLAADLVLLDGNMDVKRCWIAGRE
ncbi:MAG: N-acetylglucosamine-6-phosphate deacetylase [Sneathiella sp.]|uniref:N-acetylglucosamine-6-phosphate deacetylase n=1 Tax=Sneathiella sp. TaxID=1964365 RepID=UPI000C572B91|nr:N-acetylglucosamine-6-phosphate deacetylase [Sneathiella sp.]MAZ04096.1 N-acetylglucosamine-6-phosphate deacetylase [Sneathiella sp.]